MASPEHVLTPRTGRVKAARRLATRRFREKERAFLAEGPQAVREALDAATREAGQVREVYATPDVTARYPELVAAAGSRWQVVDDQVVAAISETVSPQGVVAVCDYLDVPLSSVLERSPRLVAVCAEVRDPGNAGAVVRCADAAGADAVILLGDSVDPYNPKAVRASVGSLFHLDVVVERDTAAAVSALQAVGLRVLAADGVADVDLFAAEQSGLLDGPTAWLFGNEAWGLPAATRALADTVVAVPIFGRAESLNLATAAAVCLYASARAGRTTPAEGRRP
ncbi:RNA methyltransferase [Mumia sp. zg.B17]|uniref:TrmH family RNA methyltransferase n=1 Tax=unclassified Mumia TaxID=2621872 RepID=UPI001C6E63A2|nr:MULTISPECIES: RNA methyltransferase [unclassified Mumia]MBW9206001.1 RNA methyltransferase [Mumia sp. zg.B17]MDD9347415.1 RNA methyltransferase [Mumia sp.]